MRSKHKDQCRQAAREIVRKIDDEEHPDRIAERAALTAEIKAKNLEAMQLNGTGSHRCGVGGIREVSTRMMPSGIGKILEK